MTMVMMLRAMQGLCAACWLVPFLCCWASVLRILLGRGRGDDPIWTMVWFMACSQIGFIARWFLFGAVIPAMSRNELVMWAGLYMLSAGVALSVMFVVRRSERPWE